MIWSLQSIRNAYPIPRHRMHDFDIGSRLKPGLNVMGTFRIVPFQSHNHSFELRIGMKRNLRDAFNVANFQVAKHLEYVRFGYIRFYTRNTYIRRHFFLIFGIGLVYYIFHEMFISIIVNTSSIHNNRYKHFVKYIVN